MSKPHLQGFRLSIGQCTDAQDVIETLTLIVAHTTEDAIAIARLRHPQTCSIRLLDFGPDVLQQALSHATRGGRYTLA